MVIGLPSVLDYLLSSADLRILRNANDFLRLLHDNGLHYSLGYSWMEVFKKKIIISLYSLYS